MAASSSSSSSQTPMPEMSLRMVPGPSQSSSASMQTTQHPSHAGVHDTLRHGHRNLSHETSSAGRHPVEARLEGWEATRDSFKMTMHRNMYGMGVPVKSMLERRAVDWDPHFPTLHQYPGDGIGGSTRGGFSQMQRDILDGNDEMIRPKDYLPTPATSGPQIDMHAVMERKHGI